MRNSLLEFNRSRREAAKADGEYLYEGHACRKNPRHGNRRYTSTGACVQCQTQAAKKRYDSTAARERSRKYWKDSPEKMLWYAARKRARDKGLPFSITPDDIVIPAICPVFQRPIESPSVDRIRNLEGYVPGNIMVISRRANTIKLDATVEEIRAVLRYVEGQSDPLGCMFG